MPKPRKKPAKLQTPDFDLGVRKTFAVSPANLSAAVGRPLAGGVASLEVRVSRTRVDQDGRKRVPGARAALDIVTQAVPGDANGKKRSYRIHPLERMKTAGTLTPAQADAGMIIVKAWEGTQLGGSSDLSAPRVDTTPRPDQQTMITLEASHRYAAAIKPVPRLCRAIVEWVCLEGESIRGFSTSGARRAKALVQLRDGLDMVANNSVR